MIDAKDCRQLLQLGRRMNLSDPSADTGMFLRVVAAAHYASEAGF